MAQLVRSLPAVLTGMLEKAHWQNFRSKNVKPILWRKTHKRNTVNLMIQNENWFINQAVVNRCVGGDNCDTNKSWTFQDSIEEEVTKSEQM